MNYRVTKISGGVLYIDSHIICIKRDRKHLDVYELAPFYKRMLSIEVARRTNKVGRYNQGIFYFQDKSTYFHSFSEGEERKEEGRFYYQYDSNYKGYTEIQDENHITLEAGNKIKVPILQHGGRKLFLNIGIVQAEEIGNGSGSIIYHAFADKGNESWRQSYSKLTKSDNGNIHSDIISSHGKLFFVITGNENRGLFVLDQETGEVLQKYNELYFSIFQDHEFIYTTQHKNKLCKINTHTLEWEEWDCGAMLKESGIESIHDHRCYAHNGKFYFTQTIGDTKAKLGVLDWETKSLEYRFDFEPENGAIGSIQATKDRIFVHTQDGTLHIFEREA